MPDGDRCANSLCGGDQMKVLKFEGRKITLVEIPKMNIHDELKASQNMIGGYIETICISKDAVMLVDEDGYCKCLPPNPSASAFAGQMIVGTALVVGTAANADGDLYFTDVPKRFTKENA